MGMFRPNLRGRYSADGVWQSTAQRRHPINGPTYPEGAGHDAELEQRRKGVQGDLDRHGDRSQPGRHAVQHPREDGQGGADRGEELARQGHGQFEICEDNHGKTQLDCRHPAEAEVGAQYLLQRDGRCRARPKRWQRSRAGIQKKRLQAQGRLGSCPASWCGTGVDHKGFGGPKRRRRCLGWPMESRPHKQSWRRLQCSEP